MGNKEESGKPRLELCLVFESLQGSRSIIVLFIIVGVLVHALGSLCVA